MLKGALTYEAVEGRSAMFINRPDLNFDKKPFPVELQASVLNDFLVMDVDMDDHLDIIAAGNFHDFHTRIEAKDASYGHILLGNGQGDFVAKQPTTTGMYLTGVIKHLDTLNINGETHLIAVKNDDDIESYTLNVERYSH